MKIYFAGSIRGGRDDAAIYRKLIDYLKNYGQVLTEHIGEKNIRKTEKGKGTDQEIHTRDMEWLLESDAIIAEVSNPSLGVGYEIGRAIEHNIPVFCLWRNNSEHKLSAMIAGSPKLKYAHYENIAEAKTNIDQYLKNFESSSDH
ncbi:MAG TPA: nucleoside 2-deoxyribosyltransferase [bacterium]|nr:nucleoside 2-deoxyribosyltransferase [bacterium]